MEYLDNSHEFDDGEIITYLPHASESASQQLKSGMKANPNYLFDILGEIYDEQPHLISDIMGAAGIKIENHGFGYAPELVPTRARHFIEICALSYMALKFSQPAASSAARMGDITETTPNNYLPEYTPLTEVSPASLNKVKFAARARPRIIDDTARMLAQHQRPLLDLINEQMDAWQCEEPEKEDLLGAVLQFCCVLNTEQRDKFEGML